MAEILKDRAATCLAVAGKFLVLGTDWGNVHVLDTISGNECKMFDSHEARVNDIAVDKNGDYIASCNVDYNLPRCLMVLIFIDYGVYIDHMYPQTHAWVVSCTGSDDGKVCIRSLYTNDSQELTFDRPVKAIAIEPDFLKSKKRQFVIGGLAGELILNEKGWFGNTTKKVVRGQYCSMLVVVILHAILSFF